MSGLVVLLGVLALALLVAGAASNGGARWRAWVPVLAIAVLSVILWAAGLLH